jgi:cell division protein FtsN
MVDEQEGVSSRQLLAAFFAVVVLCAVFFSLGFFLGHQERSPQSALATEQVPSSSSDAPPAVNTPDQAVSSGAAASPALGASKGQGTAAAAPPESASPSSSAGLSTRETSAGSTAPETQAPVAAPREEQVMGPPAQPTAEQQVALHTAAPAASVPSGARRVPPGPLVQVAALTNEQDANDMLGVLRSRGYAALILTPQQAHARDNLFRVVAGPYKTRAQAEEARGKLAAAGFKPFIRP